MKIPRVETLIILVFFGCVVLWAISKCGTQRADFVRHARELNEDEPTERPTQRDTAVARRPTPPPVNTQNPTPAPPVATTPTTAAPIPQPGAQPARPTISNQPSPAAAEPSATNPKYATLYVTIEGLKVRKEPGLKGETIAKLQLYEPVTFLNQKTDWTQEISLGLEKVTDHWVKIRTQTGKEGWVFGAGLHYYKMKRQGVLE
ncbi:MAG: SH3 domain-containing protein [Saprospiraceae bacterium]|nr:SH3 domain-containing protein [Saprospiraceae bacterium]